MKPVYLPITPPAPSWPLTCSCSVKFPFSFRMLLARAGVVPPDTLYLYPTLIAASILGLRTISRLLLNLRHGPCNLINLCIACSLPGNRRARSSFYRVSSAISGGPTILFPRGFILACRRVPGTRSVPSGRSYITSHYRPQAVQSLPLLR